MVRTAVNCWLLCLCAPSRTDAAGRLLVLTNLIMGATPERLSVLSAVNKLIKLPRII